MAMDYSELRKLADRMNRLEREFDNWMHQFLLSEGMRFLREVRPRTPVDTGDLRSHWQIDGVTRHGDVLQVWFVNSMYYATFVEYGHAKPYKSGAAPGSPDWVDGYFMMTVSIEIIQSKMPVRFEQQFQQFLKSLGVV